MAKGKFVSYLRVSTATQGKSGLGLEAQREAVAQYLNGGNWELVQEVIEAITTLPERMVYSSPSTAISLSIGRWNVSFISELKAAFAAFSATKSCGRLGPEMAGTIVPISKCNVSV